jgi:hypothetical protein
MRRTYASLSIIKRLGVWSDTRYGASRALAAGVNMKQNCSAAGLWAVLDNQYRLGGRR